MNKMSGEENNDKILEEIQKNRTEIRNFIEASENRILLRLEDLNGKIKELERENQHLKNKVEFLERGSKKNSILIYGLQSEENYTVDDICDNLRHLLDISLSTADINDCYLLDIPKHPFKIDLISNLKKQEIFQNCKKLKGSNIGITSDLTYNQRQDYKILKEHLKAARKDKNVKSFIKGSKLVIGEKIYSVDFLRNKNQNKPAASIEPLTPTIEKSKTEESANPKDILKITSTLQSTSQQQTDKNTAEATKTNQKKNITGPAIKNADFRDRLRSHNKI